MTRAGLLTGYRPWLSLRKSPTPGSAAKSGDGPPRALGLPQNIHKPRPFPVAATPRPTCKYSRQNPPTGKNTLPIPALAASAHEAHPPTPPRPIPARSAARPSGPRPPPAKPMAGGALKTPPHTGWHADTLPAVARAEFAALKGSASAANVAAARGRLAAVTASTRAQTHLQLPLSQQVLAPPQLLCL